MPKKIEMTGKRFGRLLVVGPAGCDVSNGNLQWNCQCDCGNQVVVDGYRLRRGLTTSCGCWRKETSHLNSSRNSSFQHETRRLANLVDENDVSYSSIHLSSRNRSGVIGVNFDKLSGRWFARLQYHGEMLLLESFSDKQAAIRARKQAEQQIPALRRAWEAAHGPKSN